MSDREMILGILCLVPGVAVNSQGIRENNDIYDDLYAVCRYFFEILKNLKECKIDYELDIISAIQAQLSVRVKS